MSAIYNFLAARFAKTQTSPGLSPTRERENTFLKKVESRVEKNSIIVLDGSMYNFSFIVAGFWDDTKQNSAKPIHQSQTDRYVYAAQKMMPLTYYFQHLGRGIAGLHEERQKGILWQTQWTSGGTHISLSFTWLLYMWAKWTFTYNAKPDFVLFLKKTHYLKTVFSHAGPKMALGYLVFGCLSCYSV